MPRQGDIEYDRVVLVEHGTKYGGVTTVHDVDGVRILAERLSEGQRERMVIFGKEDPHRWKVDVICIEPPRLRPGHEVRQHPKLSGACEGLRRRR